MPKDLLKALYFRCLDESLSNYEKGKCFEEFVRFFFRNIDGFSVMNQVLDIGSTDLDVVCINRRQDPPFDKLGTYIVVQCKNIKDAVSDQDLMNLEEQARAYGPFCRCAIMATSSRLSRYARTKLKEINHKGKIFIVPIEHKDWEMLFRSNLSEIDFLIEMINQTPKKYKV